MMNKSHLPALKRSLATALNSAVAARRRLAAATEAAGEVYIKDFLTRDEHRAVVRAMRRDHEAEIAEKKREIACRDDIVTGARRRAKKEGLRQ